MKTHLPLLQQLNQYKRTVNQLENQMQHFEAKCAAISKRFKAGMQHTQNILALANQHIQ